MVASMLFPLGVRLSTWVVLLVFVSIAAWRSDRRPLVAAVAWLAGFEAAYQVSAMLLRTPSHVPLIGPVSISLLVGAPAVAAAMTLLGARPNLVVLSLAALAFIAWLASGFHVNTTDVVVNPTGEALNDAAKTLWALAYLVPLWTLSRPQISRAGNPP